jgi:hypothetical protein
VAGFDAAGHFEIDLAFDRQGVGFHLQVEFLLRHTGQIGIQGDSRSILDDVDRRQQGGFLAGGLAS